MIQLKLFLAIVLLASTSAELVQYWPITNQSFRNMITENDLNSQLPIFVQNRFGEPGEAFRVTNESTHVYAPPGVYFESSFTVTLWMIAYDSSAWWARIFDFGQGVGNNNVIFAYSTQSTRIPAVKIYNGSVPITNSSYGAYIRASENIFNFKWNHFALVVDSINVSIYINGKFAGGGLLKTKIPQVARNNCYFGKSSVSSDSFALAGYDEIKIYNHAMTANEVALDYSSSVAVSGVNTSFYDHLTNYWPVINSSTVDVVAGANLDSYKTSFGPDRNGQRNSAFSIYDSLSYFWAPRGNYFSSTNFSITLWINPNMTSEWVRVFDFGNGLQLQNFFISFQSTPKFTITHLQSSFFSVSRISNNSWYHIGLTYSNQSGFSFYINGILSSTFSINMTNFNQVRWVNYFGKGNWPDIPVIYAYFDEIKFFSKALSINEVLYDYLANQIDYPNLPSQETWRTIDSPDYYSNMTNYWPINDNDLADYVRYFDLVSNSTPVFVTDRYGRAKKAISVNSTRAISAPPGVYFASEFTITGWVNVYNSSIDHVRLIDFGINKQFTVMFTVSASPYFALSWNTSSVNISDSYYIVYSSVNAPSLKWNHFALTVNSSSAWFYMNGQLIALGNLEAPVAKLLRTSCLIGQSQWSSDPSLNGEIDELKIFNRSLNADEIFYDYSYNDTVFMSQMDTSFYDSLTHYWPLDNGSLADVVAGYNLTRTGGAKTFVPDRYGNASSAVRVTGSSNYLKAPAGIYFTTEFTITAWTCVYSMGNRPRLLDFGGDVFISFSYDSNPKGQVMIYVTKINSQTSSAYSKYSITTSSWYHMAMSVNTTTASLYLNGILAASVTLSLPILVESTSRNYFGKGNWNIDDYADADFDEIKFFGKALTQQQIIYDYLTNSTPYTPIHVNQTIILNMTSETVVDQLASGVDMTDCLNNCSNHGYCVQQGQTAVCICYTNYTGSSCQLYSDPCAYYPCLNNGECTSDNDQTSFTCNCTYPYSGTWCQIKEDVCINVSCSNNGVCKKTADEAICSCYYLYSGSKCENESSRKQIIVVVASVSSTIAIITIIMLYMIMVSIDLFNAYQFFKQLTTPKYKSAVQQFRYKP